MDTFDALELTRAIRAHSGLELSSIRDAATHGADSGFAGFTYYTETGDFYDDNAELLWRLLALDADAMGYTSVPAFIASFRSAELADDYLGFKCLVSWYALEAAGQFWLERAEERTVSR